jgi:hypothetical protein
MKITTLSTISTLIAAAFLSIGTAQATTVLVDDFNTPSVLSTIRDTTADGLSVASITSTSHLSAATERLIGVNLTEDNSGSGEIKATVGGLKGFLNFSVSTGDSATGVVFWSLPALTLPSGDSAFTLSVIASALGSLASGTTPNHIDFVFAGNSGTFALGADISALGFMNPGTPINFGLNGTQSNILADGGLLSLAFSGGQGWNLALDQFSIESTPANVPVPASAALFGIALVAMRLVGKKSAVMKK